MLDSMTAVGPHELRFGGPAAAIAGGEIVHADNANVGNPTVSEGLYLVLRQSSWDEAWELQHDLLVEIRTSWEEVVASTYLTVQEYGVGPSLETGIQDLLTSLSDYYQSLQARGDRLGPSEVEDLQRLRSLIGPKSTA